MTLLPQLFKPAWTKVQWRRRLIDAALLLSIPLIGMLDALGGGQIRLSAFFLIPIMLITWRMGVLPGYAATAAALIILLVISMTQEKPGSSQLLFAIDEMGRFVAFFVIVGILARLRKAYAQQRSLATRDPLTNLFNRLGMQEILRIEIEASRRNRQSFLLLFLDCDNFKSVNDTWGHPVGDKLLQAVAQSIAGSIRRSDFACRLGGDEFVVYAAAVEEPLARQLLGKLRENLDAAMRAGRWDVTFSVGAAVFESMPESADEALAFVDKLMYESKKAGKDSLRFASFRRGVSAGHNFAMP